MRAHRLYHQPVQEIGTYITFYRVSIFEFEEALTVIFCAEGPYDFPLKKLEFVRCDLRDNRIASILPFLQSGKQLEVRWKKLVVFFRGMILNWNVLNSAPPRISKTKRWISSFDLSRTTER
mmetsp:Transcript_23925/g.49544  ORF Transcript_23925/g.49544 Transcript_23925/m.49544 type:complete len:121 (-) Transcript_23925:821-1183(-)